MIKSLYYFIVFFLLLSCQNQDNSKVNNEGSETTSVEIYGSTQGTTYAILCNDDIDINKSEIDSILSDFDMALSTYIDSSIISKLNASGEGVFKFQDPQGYFTRCYEEAFEIYMSTDGCFDPTIGAVMKLWKFDDQKPIPPDSIELSKAHALVSFGADGNFDELVPENDTLNQIKIYQIEKLHQSAILDFNAIAQGLSVDIISEFIESRGGDNYLVEIGGELRSKGKNAEGKDWRVGIDQPNENSNAQNRELTAIAKISGQAIATSGNYRKFFEYNGEKYSHTIDPKTGYPVKHNLLSATVIANSCSKADAYATAFMVMGTDQTKQFLKINDEELKVHLIYYNPTSGEIEAYTSPEMEKILKKLDN